MHAVDKKHTLSRGLRRVKEGEWTKHGQRSWMAMLITIYMRVKTMTRRRTVTP